MAAAREKVPGLDALLAEMRIARGPGLMPVPAPHPALQTAEEMDLFAARAVMWAGPGYGFELGPEHTPGAEWCALNLRVPGHSGRVRVCATMVPRPSPGPVVMAQVAVGSLPVGALVLDTIGEPIEVVEY